MSHNITIKGGEAKKLLTAGKYCDSDIVITAENGGIDLPNLTNEGRAEDLIAGRQLIDSEGHVVIGKLSSVNKLNSLADSMTLSNEKITYKRLFKSPITITSEVSLNRPAAEFGNASADMVAKGNTFTSINGVNIEGLAEVRTSEDITVNNETAIVSIPRGFYEAYTEKAIDVNGFYQTGFNEGFTTGEDEGYKKGYLVGEEIGYNIGVDAGVLKVKNEELKTKDDILVDGVLVRIPKGYYNDGITKVADDSGAYSQGVEAGRIEITEGQKRSEDDVKIEDTYINIPFGYYPRDMGKYFDVSPYFYDGFMQGLEAGKQSVILPDITNEGTSDDLLQGKQLIGSNKSVITGNIAISHGGIFKKANEAKYGIGGGVPIITLTYDIDKPLYISPKTGPTISLNTDAVNFGYASTDMVMQGATFTSKNGLCLVGTAPRRTDADAIYADLSVIMPEGFYQSGVVINTERYYDEGYEDGLTQGGGSGELHHLLLEQIQSENVVRINANTYCYDVGIYGSSIDYESTFDDYIDIENSSISSNPLTISVDNYTDLYLYLYLRVKDLGNDEQYITTVIVPPNWNNSVDVVSHTSMGERYKWQTEIIGARFTIDEI